MEQVAANHGDEIRQIRARCVNDLLTHPLRVELPTTFQAFYDFPKVCGFEFKADFTLSFSQDPSGHETLSFFIQAWLFFGLISTIIQIDQEPILSFDELHHCDHLSTRNLHEAIDRWTEWEISHREESRFRMIRVGWVLDLARQVIQKNFAYDDLGEVDMTNDDHIESLPGGGKGEELGHASSIDEIILVLMCLGETLSAAKARILEKGRVGTTGWHGDDDIGWGPPRYVFDKMIYEGWCPRAIAILRGQVNSNATMLIAAYQAYRKSHRISAEHRRKRCTKKECKVKTGGKGEEYKTVHIKSCSGENCMPCGPSEDDVLTALRGGYIPLLVLSNGSKGEKTFKVISFDPIQDLDTQFVAITHVWSHGWGNENENKLNHCQIEFIHQQIKRVMGRTDTPFWMDSLVVPVAKGQEDMRTRALQQIGQAFHTAICTIILDNGLSEMDRGTQPAEAAMQIFTSVWMKRLWTLQEAYFSREIYVPFQEREKSADNIVSLSGLNEELGEMSKMSTSGITQMLGSQLSHMLMREDGISRSRLKNVRMQRGDLEESGPLVVLNTYRAARFRATGKPEHEILALSTLLELNTENTGIEEAGLAAPGAGGSSNANRLDELICIFWDELHKQKKGIIPPGMIFLPGEKVNRQGFGWAPRTWFSTYEMDYPDPLSFWNSPAELDHEKGLAVHYAGFLLHPNSSHCRKRILGTSLGSGPFMFPVDRSLSQWYSFERLYDLEAGQLNQLTRLERENSQLAIILSGRLPTELPKEIALLVEVTSVEAVKTFDTTSNRPAVEYCVSIIHRILIRREPNHLVNSDAKVRFKMGYVGAGENECICIGEALSPLQRWWVDGAVTPTTESYECDVAVGTPLTESELITWILRSFGSGAG